MHEVEVVSCPDELLAREEGMFLKKTEPDAINDRINRKAKDEDEGGCNENKTMGLFVLSQRDYS